MELDLLLRFHRLVVLYRLGLPLGDLDGQLATARHFLFGLLVVDAPPLGRPSHLVPVRLDRLDIRPVVVEVGALRVLRELGHAAAQRVVQLVVERLRLLSAVAQYLTNGC